ncbi:cytochrome P450 [Neolentinus lepideus HHB14362 ss-1]|uniref:Cytochrome P450 n=1 Tax=Neolentinus lepideus HHB14362 ss-1 TaxID=1314782 RepID=A0A165RPD7_9AGAM|nr:cytochrome P450 [Neolentinus lepideus HHB14362 ss-1]
MSNYSAVLVLATLAALALASYGVQQSRKRLPPGPKGHFLFGVSSSVIGSQPWKTYTNWAKQYGPLTYFRTARRDFLILSSTQAVSDLMEKRAAIYSDRPHRYLWDELVGRKNSVFNISSRSERFRKYRRLLGSGLNSKAILNYTRFFERELQNLLQSLHHDPEKFTKHLQKFAGGTIMQITYGYQVTGDDDPFIEIIETNNLLGVEGTTPGKFLVDSFPILRFIPTWFPGAHFHREVKRYRQYLNREHEIPYRWVKEQMAKGVHEESFMSRLLSSAEELSSEDEDCIRWTSAGLYTGGADTTVSSMITFFMAMALYPEIQKRAQEELDAVIGRKPGENCICRLPSPGDRGKLPYVEALIKEILRWGNTAPVGLPHSLVVDDEYMGYDIPKGTTVIANIWALLQDPSTYPTPEVFDPTRFLLSEQREIQPDPRDFAFGFGRRSCPGQQFAEISLFLQIASILGTYRISPYINEDGKEIFPVREYINGIVAHPVPFQVKISPRSEAALSALYKDS